MSDTEYAEWLRNHFLAETSIDNREELLLESAMRLENKLTLLGRWTTVYCLNGEFFLMLNVSVLVIHQCLFSHFDLIDICVSIHPVQFDFYPPSNPSQSVFDHGKLDFICGRLSVIILKII